MDVFLIHDDDDDDDDENAALVRRFLSYHDLLSIANMSEGYF